MYSYEGRIRAVKLYLRVQEGVRSFIITFDVYVILNIFEKYENKRPDPLCPIF